MMRFVSGLGTGKRCFKMVAVLWPIYSIIKCKYILVKKIEEKESDIKVNDIYLVHEIITIPVMPNKTKASKISLNQSLFQLQKINCHWIPTTVTVTTFESIPWKKSCWQSDVGKPRKQFPFPSCLYCHVSWPKYVYIITCIEELRKQHA